jgi:hypothetical protein
MLLQEPRSLGTGNRPSLQTIIGEDEVNSSKVQQGVMIKTLWG